VVPAAALAAALVVQLALPGYHAQVATIRADGTGLRALTNPAIDSYHPVWSPDHRAIAFFRTGARTGIYLLRLPRHTVRLTHGRDSTPAFSPDGTEIAFVRDRHLMTMRADGTGVRRVAALTLALAPRQIAWTPDGSQLIVGSSGFVDSVYVRTGEVRQLWTGLDSVQGDFKPVVSPDGARIAFLSYRDAAYVRDRDAWGIWTMPVGGGTPTRLCVGTFGPMSWGPDGSILASFGYELAVFAPDGTHRDLPVRGLWASY
jgi:Tol biopolymer transport system component